MQAFQFNPSDYVSAYAREGFVHIKSALAPEFLGYALRQFENLLAKQDGDMKEREIKGKKLQFLFEFPADCDIVTEIYQKVAEVAGVPGERLTLCERHINAYEKTAAVNPPPHKDRLASQITVGLPLRVPINSYLILYPEDYRETNPFVSAAAWRDSLDQAQLPERVLADIEPVRLEVPPGDILVFRGNSTYHERVNPAETVVLYLKFNAMGLDPIGEDPFTLKQRNRSLEMLQQDSDEQLLERFVRLSPRLDKISRHHTRLYWKEVIQAYVWGEKEFTLSELEFQLLKQIDEGRVVRDVMDRLGIPPTERLAHVEMFRRLADLQGLDFVR